MSTTKSSPSRNRRPRRAPRHPAAQGASRPPGPRGPDGRVLAGNTLALTHGLRRRPQDPPARRDPLAHLQPQVDAFVAGAIRDEGGGEIPTRRKSLLEYRARLHRRIVQLDEAIDGHGLLDRRGRLRATWLQRLESMMNTAKALDQLLGLARRPPRVPDLALALRQSGDHEEEE